MEACEYQACGSKSFGVHRLIGDKRYSAWVGGSYGQAWQVKSYLERTSKGGKFVIMCGEGHIQPEVEMEVMR